MFYPYVKKEDIREAVDSQRKLRAIVLLSAAGTTGMLRFLVAPRLIELYADFGVRMPSHVVISLTFSAVLTIALTIAGGYLLLSKSDYTKATSVAKKYKSGEMIRIKELLDYKLEWAVIIALLAVVVYQVLSLIIPIYSLTSQM